MLICLLWFWPRSEETIPQPAADCSGAVEWGDYTLVEGALLCAPPLQGAAAVCPWVLVPLQGAAAVALGSLGAGGWHGCSAPLLCVCVCLLLVSCTGLM